MVVLGIRIVVGLTSPKTPMTTFATLTRSRGHRRHSARRWRNPGSPEFRWPPLSTDVATVTDPAHFLPQH
jgi:hypothetical protein